MNKKIPSTIKKEEKKKLVEFLQREKNDSVVITSDHMK